MPEINAKMVNDLRAKTGLPMMECKKLLVETGGDGEKAYDLARKRGVKTSITERLPLKAALRLRSAPTRSAAPIVEIVCNTDFTAKSDPVLKVAKIAVEACWRIPESTPRKTPRSSRRSPTCQSRRAKTFSLAAPQRLKANTSADTFTRPPAKARSPC